MDTTKHLTPHKKTQYKESPECGHKTFGGGGMTDIAKNSSLYVRFQYRDVRQGNLIIFFDFSVQMVLEK